LLFAVSALIAGAAVLFAISKWRDSGRHAAPRLSIRIARFMIDGKPFRFVGANAAVMYRDEDARACRKLCRQAARLGIRSCAFGRR